MKTLVIDDVRSNAEILRIFLQEHGEVVATNTGQDGINLFKESIESNSPFNLVCLDLHLPDLSGLEVLQYLRRLEDDLKSIKAKVILITTDDSGHTKNIDSYGCDKCIIKPLTKKQLINSLIDLGLI